MITLAITSANDNNIIESKNAFISINEAIDYVEKYIECQKKKIGTELTSVSCNKWFGCKNKYYRSMTLYHNGCPDNNICFTIEEK